ncbi:MAG: hypothetical protein M5U26_00145 [Planctomycetota bacterium]|nr:hypothetical protein [Planctomycetota bacterium]
MAGGAKKFLRRRGARGSILVFALVLIAILAALGAATVFYVVQQARASANALRHAGSDHLLDSGELHVLKLIRDTVRAYEILSPDGIFEPTLPTNAADHAYLDIGPDSPAGVPQHNVFRALEGYTSEKTVAATANNPNGHAWLYWNEDSNYCGTTLLEPAAGTPLRYADSTLAHANYPNGQARAYYANGPEHAGLARRWPVDNNLDDFYAAGLPGTKLPRVSGFRGEYYAWAADLDGKLYADPKSWGLDPDFFTSLPGVETNETAAKAILATLSLYGDAPTWTTAGASYAGMKLSAALIDALWLRPSAPAFNNLGEMALALGVAVPASGTGSAVWDYYNQRYGFERYFTVKQDTALNPAEAASLQTLTAVKETETALNVNTAPFEVLLAALSRIPLVDAYTPADAGKVNENIQKAAALAARICAKRPFLGRIDFEDFLAAHLTSDPVAAPVDDPADATKPVGMIKAALPKREVVDMAAFLDLDAYGVSTANLAVQNPLFSDTAAKPLNGVVSMAERFDFFRTDNAAAPLANALIGEAAFNNLLNATGGKRRDGTYGYSYYSFENVKDPIEVTGFAKPKFEYTLLDAAAIALPREQYDLALASGTAGALNVWRATKDPVYGGYYEMHFGSDDLQKYAFDAGTALGVAPDPYPIVIEAGADGVLQTPKLSDDDDTAGTNITTGPNYLAETWIHGPIRAYRLPNDAALTTPVADLAVNNGDVAWAPRFGFRSRFFLVYVLARPYLGKEGGVDVYGPPQRSELVYDALRDQVVSRREPATEKRNLGDPHP